MCVCVCVCVCVCENTIPTIELVCFDIRIPSDQLGNLVCKI